MRERSALRNGSSALTGSDRMRVLLNHAPSIIRLECELKEEPYLISITHEGLSTHALLQRYNTVMESEKQKTKSKKTRRNLKKQKAKR